MLINNLPTFTYISWKGLAIIDKDNNIYSVLDGNTCKPYVYWYRNDPYALIDSNDKLPNTANRILLFVNKKGEGVEVPQEDITIQWKDVSMGSVASANKALVLYDKLNDKYNIMEADVNGVKEIIGSSESPSDGSIIDRMYKLEKSSEGTSETISQIKKDFADNKEMNELKDKYIDTLINLQIKIAQYETDITSYYKDYSITEEEKLYITNTQNDINSFVVKNDELLNKLIAILETSNQTEAITQLNNANTDFKNALSLLNNTINTQISDNIISLDDVTLSLNMFGSLNTKFNIYKNTVDENIILGVGGTITEQITSIKKNSEGIKQSVTEVVKEIDGENGLKDRLEKNETNILQTAKELELNYVKNNKILAAISLSEEGIKLDADKILATGTLTWDKLDDKAKENLKGEKGEAEYVSLMGEQTFKYEKSKELPSPLSIELGITTYNISAINSVIWEYKDLSNIWTRIETSTTNQSSLVINHNDSFWLGRNMIQIRCTVNDKFKDEMTLVKIYDGSDGLNGENGADGESAYTIYLTNENHSFPCENDGTIKSDISTTTDVVVYKGISEATFTIGNFPTCDGLSFSKQGNRITITALKGNLLPQSGFVEFSIIVDGNTFKKSFSWSKSFKGDSTQAEVPDWITEWDTNITEINGTKVLSPRIFAGSVSQGLPTGVALGKDVFGTEGEFGNVNGLVGYKNGKNVYSFDENGNVLIGDKNGNHLLFDGSTFEVVASNIKLGTTSVATEDSVLKSISGLEHDLQDKIAFSRADFIARNFLYTPLIVSDNTLPIYANSGVPNPPIGAVFNSFSQEHNTIKNNKTSSNGNAWAIIVGYELYKNTTDNDKKTTAKNKIKQVADFMASNVSVGRFNSMDFKFIDASYKYSSSSGTWEKSNYKEIYISTMWLQVKAMMYAYEILQDKKYLNLGLDVLDSLFNTHFYMNNKVDSKELPTFLKWASYEYLACDNISSSNRFVPSTKQYANQMGYYIHQAIKDVIRVAGDNTRTTPKGDKYKPSDILIGLKQYLKNAYETQNITSMPLGLPYGYFHRVTNADGSYSYIPQNWDFIDNTWGDTWFVGDVVTYTIYSFAACGLTDIARRYANNYYKLRVPTTDDKWKTRFSESELLFYDRIDFNTGSHLADDSSISITYTALFYEILKEIGLNEYIDSCCYTLAKHQINNLDNKNIDGGYPWDVSNDGNALEFKSFGEIINSQFYKNLNITSFKVIDSKFTEFQVTSDSIIQRVSTTEESVKVVDNLANSAHSKIDNLQIGGRNYWRWSSGRQLKTLEEIKSKWYSSRGDLTLRNDVMPYGIGLAIPSTSTTNAYCSLVLTAERTISIPKGTQVTLSMDMFVGTNSKGYAIRAFNQDDKESSQTYIVGGTTTPNNNKLVHTFSMPYDNTNFYIYNEGVKSSSTSISSSIIFTDIMLEKGNKSSDWIPANEDIDKNINDVSNALSTLDKGIKDAFGDGIINDSEAKAIGSNIQVLDLEKADVDKEYTTVYSNSKLSGTTKTNLYNAKVNFDSAHSSLKSAINNAIADKIITDSERSSVNSFFGTYGTRKAEYKQRLQEALDYISTAKVDSIEIGGRNLISKKNIKGNATTTSFNDSTNTWTITEKAGGGTIWGAGVCLTGTDVVIPYGKSYVISFEIKVPRACTWNLDVNNYSITGSANSWNGNDNDNSSYRVFSDKTISKTNEWVKCWVRYENTSPKNTSKLDIYDASVFGVVMTNETTDMTYYIRNIQGELGNKPTDWTPCQRDIDDSISKKANSSDVYTKTEVYTKNQTDTVIKNTKDAINLSVSSTYETKTNVTTMVGNAITTARSIPDTRNANENPQWYMTNYPKQTITEFKLAKTVGLTTTGLYGAVTTVVPWGDSSGGLPVQTFRNNDTGATYERRATSTTAWGDWIQIEDTKGSQAKADAAKKDAITSANSTLNTTIKSYYTKTQTDSQIDIAKKSITQSVSSTYESMTKIMEGGKTIHIDIAFREGFNNVGLYNNTGNGNVVVERITKPSDCPTTSTHCIRITHKGTASPNLGGFYQSIQSRANAIFIQKFVAKLPTGYKLNTASNNMGDGYTDKWLTSNEGTGKWETYIRQVTCGSTGTFSSGGHVHVSGTTPTTSSPLVWYLASCTAIDITDADERVTSLEKRMKGAEQKITEDAITNTVKKNFYTKTEIGDKKYQSESQVKQTVDNLQVKFSESGGYNLLRNSKGTNGTSYWASNGGGISVSSDTTYQTCFASSFPSGITYAGGENTHYIRLKNSTDYVYEAWIYSRIALGGSSTAPLHFWCSTTQGGAGASQCTIIDYRQAVSTANKWIKCYVHFKTASSGNVWFRPFIYTGGSAGDFWVTEISLSESSIETMWTPHPNEICEGIINLNKDGITVSNSSSDTKTVIDSASFSVEDNKGGTVAEFSTTSNIPELTAGIIHADEIYASNIDNTQGSASYFVNLTGGSDSNNGSESAPFKTVQKAIDSLNKIIEKNATIYITVYGSASQTVKIGGFSGFGTIRIILKNGAKLYCNTFDISECSCRVYVQGDDPFSAYAGQIINSDTGTCIYVRSCQYVEIQRLCIVGSGKGNGYAVNATFGSNVYVHTCEISRFNAAVRSEYNSRIALYNTVGSDLNYICNGIGYGQAYLQKNTGKVPNATSESQSSSYFFLNGGGTGCTKTNGTIYPPSSTTASPPTATTNTRTWSFNKIWSDETLNGWPNKSELIQGYASTWNTGRWTGYMQFTDSMASIRDAISGATNLSGRIYIQRRSTSGNSTGSKLCLYGSDGTAITTSTSINRGQGVWVSLSSAVVSKIQSGAIKYFYLKADSNNTATYFKCESNPKIEITYTK